MPLVPASVRITWSFPPGDWFREQTDSVKKAFTKRVLKEIAARIPSQVLDAWAKNTYRTKVDKDGHKPDADVEKELRQRLRLDLPKLGFDIRVAGHKDYNKVDKVICTKHVFDLRYKGDPWEVVWGKIRAKLSLMLEWDTPVPAGPKVPPKGVLVPVRLAVPPSKTGVRRRRSLLKPRNR